tara:strand:- start:6769 stop:7512 length:744 start_codon:yes stop_codon:yes gene_type:complete
MAQSFTKPKYIFDVDGTLTPSRSAIDKKFAQWLSDFCDNNDCYFVTGSDKPKTIEQIGETIYNKAKYVFQCAGNEMWRGDVLLSSGVLELSADLKQHLANILEQSSFKHKTGRNHIEQRSGLVNFSILGRPAGSMTRDLYKKHDKFTNERYIICQELGFDYDSYQFSVAGDTGIDITTKGMDKSQILKHFSDTDILYFFGDKTGSGGNDHEIALAVHDRLGYNRVFSIEGWRHTWNILKHERELWHM